MKYLRIYILIVVFSFIVFAQNFEGIKQINGAGIYCRDIGSGEPIVVVHGGPGLAHNYLFKPFSSLSDKYRLIFYDQKGCGLSESFRPDEKYTVDDLVEELEGVRKEFKLEKLNLVGQSWGAIIAIKYAAKYPQYLNKLMLLEPAPGSSSYLAQFQKTIMSRLSQDELKEISDLNKNPNISKDPEIYKQFSNLWFSTYYFDKSKQDKQKFNDLDSVYVKKKFESSAMFASFLQNFDLYETMKIVKSQVLIVHGDYDVIPVESVQKMKNYFTDCELYTIKECGHFAHIEKPDEYFGYLRKFLDK